MSEIESLITDVLGMKILQHPYLDDPKKVLAVAVGFLVVLLLGFLLRFNSKKKYENQLKQVVKNIAVDYKRDVYLPDGIEATVHIRYLILSHYGIVILNVQNYPGNLFGGENTNLWTQVYKRKSFKFENPLFHNRICAQSVKEIAHDIPVISQVVFTHAGKFPKGKPVGTCLTFELQGLISANPRVDVIPDSYLKDWDKIISISSKVS